MQRLLLTSLLLASLLACGDDSEPAAAAGGSGGQAGLSGASGTSGQAGQTGASGAAGSGGLYAVAQCGGPLMEVSQETFPDDCGGLAEEPTMNCVEQRFWQSMRERYDQRGPVHELLGTTIAAWEGKAKPSYVANLYFRRGQLALALALENKDGPKILTIKPDFEKALQIQPDHPLVPTWKDTIDFAFAVLQNDTSQVNALFEKALKNIDLCPLGNIPSLSGTTIGLPLSTGIPQQTIALVDQWKCEGVAWCEQNTWKGPYVVPGMNYHMGEAYARMGQRDKALSFFQAALASPGADTWPYRSLVQERTDHIDDFIGTFTALGEEGSAFTMVYSNQDFGCKFCHGLGP